MVVIVVMEGMEGMVGGRLTMGLQALDGNWTAGLKGLLVLEPVGMDCSLLGRVLLVARPCRDAGWRV